jgi:uncharacterized protein (DUF849 family)
LLKACLNSSRRPAEHPALAVTVLEIAADAAIVVIAGADALYVHSKDEQGVDTLDRPSWRKCSLPFALRCPA